MSAEPRYYYVDAQNQAAGPIAMAGLLALKAAGTVTDATLVVAEGGTEWVAFSTLKPAAAPASTLSPTTSPLPVAQAATASAQSPSSSSAAEPLWASQLSQKVDRLTAAMERLIVSLEKSRPPAPTLAPATAALHAEKVNLNIPPKPGIAALGPSTATSAPNPGIVPRPNPMPAGLPTATPKTAGIPGVVPRPGLSTPLTPLAVPANAKKSALPLPALGQPPAPAVQPKGNIFSKFLKK